MTTQDLSGALQGKSAPIILPCLNDYSITLSGGGSISITKGCVNAASVVVQKYPDTDDGVLIITGLEGTGDPYAMKIMAALIRGISSELGKTCYLGVFTSNPKYEKLIKHYERILGATQTTMLMKVGGN